VNALRKSFLLLVCFCLLLSVGCATMGGATGDIGRRDVTNAVDRLASAYAGGNPDVFMSLVSVRYAGIYGELEKRVIKDIADTPGVVYLMETDGVSMNDTGRYEAEVTWERNIITDTGPVANGSGTAVLVFDLFDSVLKLTDQRGDPPFPPEF